MSRWLRSLCLALLVCCFFVGGAVSVHAGTPDSAVGGSDGGLTHPQGHLAFQEDDPEGVLQSNTTILVAIQSNGDARWTITEAFNLTTDTKRQAFEETAQAFRSGGSDGSEFGLDSFRRAKAVVNASTERPMEIRDLERSVDTTNATLSLSFTWTNFARIENGTIFVDDVLSTSDGPWLPGLTEDQRLVVRAPEDLGIDNANVPPRDGELRWQGPATFTNETLQSSFVGEGSSPTVTPTMSPTSTPLGDPQESSNILPSIVGGTVVVFILAVLVLRRDDIGAALQGDEASAETQPDTPEPDTPAEPTDETEETTHSSETTEDAELLSDEERVERLLEANGGRMKQATIVNETDWSNAKVSQLLSSMDDDGRIDKLRIGRENLISLPDEDVTDFDYDDK